MGVHKWRSVDNLKELVPGMEFWLSGFDSTAVTSEFPALVHSWFGLFWQTRSHCVAVAGLGLTAQRARIKGLCPYILLRLI